MISNFSNVYKGISKMTSQNHVKRLEVQSHQRRYLCLYSARNDGPKTGSGGGRHHPPTLLGLSIKSFFIALQMITAEYIYSAN